MTAQDLLPQAMDLEETHDPFLDASVRLEQAARFLDLEDWIVQRLRHTEREVTVNLPLMHDGEALTVTGLRVQHNSSRGPALGGVRFCRNAHLGQLKALAMENTWQAALLDLPFGGSAGALVCNPEELPERELRLLSKNYVAALREVIGPHRDILVPDTGANERTMAWMLDAYRQSNGGMDFGVVLGKPASLRGLDDPHAIAAQSVLLLLREVLSERHHELAAQRVAIQGFDPVAARTARVLHDTGACIVAVADISGGLHNARGINIPALQAYAEDNHVIYGFTDAESVCNADVLEARCDVLVLAAAERQVTGANAHRIRAPFVVETVRGPVTPTADKILGDNGVTVVPDLLGSAGAMLACFVEWSEHRCGTPGMSGMERALQQHMDDAYSMVRMTAHGNQLSLRDAVHVVAVDKVASALRML